MNQDIKTTIEKYLRIPANYTFATDSMMRAADLLYRSLCTTGSNVVAMEPTRPEYRLLATINKTDYITVKANEQLTVTADQLLKAANRKTRLIWICRPDLATGTAMKYDEIVSLLTRFEGYVVVDESMVEYARQRPLRNELPKFPRLITLSEPGIIFAQPEVISAFEPFERLYATIRTEAEISSALQVADNTILQQLQERDRMMEAFRLLPFCERVYPSDSNFFVVKLRNHKALLAYLAERNIVLQPLAGMPDHFIIPTNRRSANNDFIGALRQYNE